MRAQRLPERSVRPLQVSLRVRHPSLDPQDISRALELEPEHCFKAGDPRGAGERPGTHPQTYWLAPVDPEKLRRAGPSFLSNFDDQALADAGLSADKIAAANRALRQATDQYTGVHLEGLLFSLLARLNLRQEFLSRVQREGGDVSLLVVADPATLRTFSLSVPVSRFLAKLNIEVEFEFESAG